MTHPLINRWWQPTAWYPAHVPAESVDQINHLREQALASLTKAGAVNPWLDQAAQASLPQARFTAFDQAAVTLGRADELSTEQQSHLRPLLEAMKPWKKGPYSLFGIDIDAEWRSDWKWQRFERHCPNLTGQTVADIGCHNGYFMFRMLAHNPELVVGFEPVAPHWLSFHFLNELAGQSRLQFELLGAEHIDLFPRTFDTIFCLGILYHHTDPVGLLRKMLQALKPHGHLMIDCQGIPGDSPLTLVPRKRYAGARGIWFLPTESALINWVRRAGFSQAETIFAEPLSTEEQRATPWAPIRSLAERLDPANPNKTMEGYPAPWRYYVKAQA